MIPEQRIRELAAYASDPCADVQHWLAAELLAARAELAAVTQLAVDKWLDDDTGKPADRAARAREVALRAIEAAEAKVEQLTKERDSEAREAAGYQKIAREAANAEEPGLLVLLVDQQGAEVRIFGPDRDAEERFGETVARWWKLLQATSEGLELEDRTKERDAARAELLSMGVKCGLLEAARDEARAEAERVTEQRDTLLAAVMDGTAEFRDWKECVADQIEGQENEVCRDHNRMLAALRTLRRKAKHVQNGPRAVVEAGSLPAHLERAEQPKPACPQCDGTRTVEKCDWPGEHANRYQEQCGECAEQPKPVEPTQEPWQFDYGGPAFPEQPKPAGGA